MLLLCCLLMIRRPRRSTRTDTLFPYTTLFRSGHGGDAYGFVRELLPPEILVMTFTDAATQELRERIRIRLTQAARLFRGEIDAPDSLVGQRSEERRGGKEGVSTCRSEG